MLPRALPFAIAICVAIPAFATEPPLDQDGPYTVDTSSNVSITVGGQTLSTDLFAPEGAPAAPLIVAAHGLDGNKANLDGWGSHFASHGFAVAIPTFPNSDNTASPANAVSVNALFDWMQTQGGMSGTFFSGRVDGSRRGIIGHSMGGLTEFLAAATSPAIQVAVGLDPVDVNSMAAAAVPTMHAFPAVLRASTVSICSAAQPNEPTVVAAFPGDYLELTVANTMHCDPMDPHDTSTGSSFEVCALSCEYTATGSRVTPSATALPVFLRYATAAMRYFLLCDSDARANLDGSAEQADVAAGTIISVTTNMSSIMPGGCGMADGGVVITPDAGTPADAGTMEVDSGVAMESDAGSLDAGSMASDGSIATQAKPAGCGCSGVDGIGLVALTGLLARKRRRIQ